MTLPLQGLRVLDLTHGAAEACGRYLADLGANVVLVEPPGGSIGRADMIGFGLRNANKRGVVFDPTDAADIRRLRSLAGEVDIVLESLPRAFATSTGITPEALLAAHPGLVVVSVTDFGRTGPYADYVATDAVLAAMGGVLSRSGLPGRPPLLPPAGLVAQTVAVHAAWAALVAYTKRLQTGEGELVDVSAFEAVVHGFDPGFGTQGSAAAGRKETFPRDRPDAAALYPVFLCADGHVRICVLAPRQWRSMFDWLGQPEEFADPKYNHIAVRFGASDRLHPLIAAHFAASARADLVAEGTKRGIPISAVLSPAEVLVADHFAASGALVDAEIADGLRARVPHGYLSIDVERVGLRHRAPRVGEHNASPFEDVSFKDAPLEMSASSGGPLAGLRVLDLGVIVFGAELTRLFADQGADVIKIENSAFPDGLRQTRGDSAMNASFAWGARNKRGLGLDLRSEEGRQIVRDLVRTADVVTGNFKPGTLDSLGLSRAQLAEINPRIIVSDSSAFGSRGPWSDRMGYGPLVRGACGVSTLWRYPEGDPNSETYCDGSTVYPDHIAAHVGAVGVLAAVLNRARTGQGCALELAQADVAVMHLGPLLAQESLHPGTVRPAGRPEPGSAGAGVYACAGDDEWCVIDVRDELDGKRLVEVTGGEDLDEWTAKRSPAEVTALLQAAGVPAGPMLRLPEQLTDPQLQERQSFRVLVHEQLSDPVPTGAHIARFSTIADPPLRPAPLPGEHTVDICSELLGLEQEAISALVQRGVLQVPEAL
ncbi:MAG TPA: CoA transferase [Sporichthya sp.]|nr:CoA transferase [Sporichthya sp.]